MKHKTIAAFLLIWIILIAAAIFWFSSKSGEESGDMSRTLMDEIFDFLEMDENTRKIVHLMIRKMAHIAEFALLGISVCVGLFFMRDAEMIRIGSYHLLAAIAWGLTTLYAVTDEIHQIFVPDRGPSVKDVLIDSAGALVGVCFVMAVGYWIAERKEKRQKQNSLSDGQQNGD